MQPLCALLRQIYVVQVVSIPTSYSKVGLKS